MSRAEWTGRRVRTRRPHERAKRASRRVRTREEQRASEASERGTWDAVLVPLGTCVAGL